MRWEQQVQYASITDVGLRRRNNQDSFAVHLCAAEPEWNERGHLFLVADGMGGHAVGELASKLAADSLPHSFLKDKQSDLPTALKLAVEHANQVIHERGTHNREFESMGTTCSSLVLSPQGALIGHVGDSRVYRIRRGKIEQLTFDHSLQWELIRLGRMKPEEVMLHQPRNVITRSLGPEPKVDVDIEGPHPVVPGDTYLICSDGLTGHVSDEEIGTIAGELSPDDACKLLVNLANLRGGSDNITVVIARVVGPGSMAEGNSDNQSLATGNSAYDMSWKSLALLWLFAIIFVTGVALALLDRFFIGAFVISFSLTGILAAILWRWKREKEAQQIPTKPQRPNEPYRIASARLTRRFISELAALQAELEQSAIEESWTVDWSKHAELDQSVQQALEKRQFGTAFRSYAQMLEIMMIGVQSHRRQKELESRKSQS